MAIILHIETSTDVCSAALSENGHLVASKVCYEGMSHASKLPVFINELLQVCRAKGQKPDAVAVSAGPGSYTGLRIGVSTVKGLCYGFDAKLIAVDTLQLMAEAVKDIEPEALICPMIDARRMEVYCALFDAQKQKVMTTEAKIIDSQSFADVLAQKPIYFCGNGAKKCQTTLTHSNARFLDNIAPLAENMIALAEQKWAEKQFEDVAYFEPFYLKEFQPTTPKK